MIVFNCPACEKQFKLSDRFAGRNLFCSGCKTELTVPEPEEELGLAPMSEEKIPTTTSPLMDIYAIPQAESMNIRCSGLSIKFDCSACGKHYIMSARFAGRPMLCSGCKSELYVPEYAEEESGGFESIPVFPVPPPPPMSEVSAPAVPPPPIPTLSDDPLPNLPMPPPVDGFTSSSGFDGFELSIPAIDDDTHRYENAVAARTEEDSAILAYVYQEKHGSEEPSEHPETPMPIAAPAIEVSPSRKKNLMFWFCTLTVLGAIIGLCVYLASMLERSEPDRRPAMLEQITQQKTRVVTESGSKETESKLLRFKALESWNTAGELIDNYVVTSGEKIPKQENPVIANRLGDFSKQIIAALKNAVELEASANIAANTAKTLTAEARFYAEEEQKLSDRIRIHPKERTDVIFPTFDSKHAAATEDMTVRFDIDWTEGDFSRFAFPGMFSERYFASYDGARRFFGEKSLRITVLEKEPIVVSFPGIGQSRQNSVPSRCFGFSIRFPEIGDRLMVGRDPEAGKIGEYRVRFVNSSGYVDFVTTSLRYCEALYYDARGRFVTVEFPLSGDSFWQRSDHFDLSKRDRSDDSIETLLSDASGDTTLPVTVPPNAEAAEHVPETAQSFSFFSQIDRVEIRLVPLSAPTTLWLDGIIISDKENLQSYDLLRAESLQSEVRRKEQETFQRRRSEAMSAVIENNKKEQENIPADEKTEPKSSVDQPAPERDPLDFAGTGDQRLRKLFVWILQDAKGRIQARVQGRLQSFGSKSSLPDSFDGIVVEEIDLSRAQNVTEEKLDRIGELKTLKKLNLAYTDLKNESLIRLATLTELESLNLAHNDLTFAAIPGIQTLKNLKELNLDGIRMSVDGIDALGNMTGLRSLSLSRSHADSNDLIYWITLTELESLDLSGSKIGDRGLTNLRAFTSLTSLNLSKTRITDAGVRQLDALRNLRRLNINETALSDVCLKSLGKLANLESVSAVKTKITRDGVRQALGPAWVGRFVFSD